MSAGYREFYRGRKVMITGGLGFIGSNLARHLVDLGADVLLVDSLLLLSCNLLSDALIALVDPRIRFK